MCDLFIFAGEASGDLHGDKLLEALLKKRPGLSIAAVAGPKMRQHKIDCVMRTEEFLVMGFIDVFLALPKLIRQFYAVRRAILKLNPKVVLFIDYPGFNLRMAKSLKKKRFSGKLCHYICPSVWAWGKKRIPLMGRTLDLLMTILPFEARYFAKTPLKVAYVGHPLAKRIQEHKYQPLDLPKDKRIISIFPGSRKKEILRNFELQLKVAKRLLALHPDLFFGISSFHPPFAPLLQKMIDEARLKECVLVPGEMSYELMRASHSAIAKSGTVTLELALHKVPTVVTYAITSLDLFIAQKLLGINLPHYCIVNIIAEGELFRELFGPNFTEENLFNALQNLLTSPTLFATSQKRCEELSLLLNKGDASVTAAQSLQDFF